MVTVGRKDNITPAKRNVTELIMKIIIIISVIFVADVANAVCLNGHPSITEECAKSQRVIIGKVIEKENIPESGNYYEGINYTVRVQEVIKGNPTKTILIFSENSSGRFPMSVGSTYVLFVYYELGRYQVSNCGNSGLMSEKQDVVQAVRQVKPIQDRTN